MGRLSTDVAKWLAQTSERRTARIDTWLAYVTKCHKLGITPGSFDQRTEGELKLYRAAYDKLPHLKDGTTPCAHFVEAQKHNRRAA